MVAMQETAQARTGPSTAADLERRIARRVVARLTGRREFVGSAFALCESVHNVDAAVLAGYLGCTPRRFVRLALARRPDPAAPDFDAAVRRLATMAGADGERLVLLLEEADRCDGGA